MTGEIGTTQGNQTGAPEANPSTGGPWCMQWMRHDSLDSIAWAASFIWAGVVILAYNLGVPFAILVEEQAWSLFFLGAGTIVLVEVTVRLLVPAYRTRVVGDIIWAGILFAIGTGNLANILPLILIAIGASILRDILRKPESQ